MEVDCDAIGLKELRQNAMLFYGCNGDGAGVTERMEEVLNNMFYDNPQDVYGHLTNYFEKFAKHPTISKLCSREVIDGRGVPTVQVDVCCEVKGNTELCSSFVTPSAFNPESTSAEDRERVELECNESVETAVKLIVAELSNLLQGCRLSDQNEIDSRLTQKFKYMQAEYEASISAASEAINSDEVPAPESPKSKGKPSKPTKSKSAAAVAIIPDEPAERLVAGCEAASAVSQAVCKSAALLSKRPLYEYISQCAECVEESETFHVPLPLLTIMSCGKAGCGKLRCIKEFMVVPSVGMPLNKAMKYFVKIFNFCSKNLSGKSSGLPLVRSTNDLGALCPQFDRPEQGLDLLLEAITAAELVPGTDFHLAINCAAPEWFDSDKGKYEVATGQLKSNEELVKFWSDLVSKYPALILLIDPIRKQDSWMQLAELVSPNCYVAGDYFYHRPGRLICEDLSADLKASAIVLSVHQMTTVTEIRTCIEKMRDCCEIIISCSPGETNDSFIADLAVGCHAKFLKIGGLCRGERVSKLNRLLEIENDLESRDRLTRWDSHVFPIIKLTLPSESDVSNQDDSDRQSVSSPMQDKKTAKKSK